MIRPFRISTSPPSFSPTEKNDASYYCDLRPIEDWRDFAIVQDLAPEGRGQIMDRGLVGDAVTGVDGKEFAILVCADDEEEGLIYFAVGHAGRVEREPAVNEALWGPANAAESLPAGHRLARTAEGNPPPP